MTLAVLLVSPATPTTSAAAGAAPHGDSAPHRDSPRWDWPLEPPHAVVRPFIAPSSPYGAGHRGIDIAAGPGAIVRAPADGTVSFAGFVVDRPVLSIQHDGGLVSSFEPVASTLSTGAVVHRGDPVGTVLAGHCEAVCMHFGVRLHGEYVSPLNYLGGIPRSVLLPTRELR